MDKWSRAYVQILEGRHKIICQLVEKSAVLGAVGHKAKRFSEQIRIAWKSGELPILKATGLMNELAILVELRRREDIVNFEREIASVREHVDRAKAVRKKEAERTAVREELRELDFQIYIYVVEVELYLVQHSEHPRWRELHENRKRLLQIMRSQLPQDQIKEAFGRITDRMERMKLYLQ